jgi:ATP-dependent Zn protease
MQMPKEDRYLLSIEELEDQIAVMMGGRAAEQVILGTVSTGAVDDIQRATQLARRMVTEFGMSEKLGSVRYSGQRLQYLGTAVAEASMRAPRRTRPSMPKCAALWMRSSDAQRLFSPRTVARSATCRPSC